MADSKFLVDTNSLPFKSECLSCVHYTNDLKCAAFPQGIATRLLIGTVLHHQPLPGDNGLQFEAKPTV